MSFKRLVTFILASVCRGKNGSLQSNVNEFFKDARRSGLWPEVEDVDKSSITKARKKVKWDIFKQILQKAVALAYSVWPDNPKYLWHNMNVYAIDGSKYNLPSTVEIREEFDPKSGLDKDGKGYYPKCTVSTLYDVLRKLPVARTVVKNDASEREEAKKLISHLRDKSVCLFDRGYISYDLLSYLKE
ncbi:MAG: transposase [Magnetococcales bacterium]|nr:transposase [Nitrospirota bacterium]